MIIDCLYLFLDIVWALLEASSNKGIGILGYRMLPSIAMCVPEWDEMKCSLMGQNEVDSSALIQSTMEFPRINISVLIIYQWIVVKLVEVVLKHRQIWCYQVTNQENLRIVHAYIQNSYVMSVMLNLRKLKTNHLTFFILRKIEKKWKSGSWFSFPIP